MIGAESLQAENDRLREALVAILGWTEVSAQDDIADICENALSVPADDWLVEHDEWVRDQEQKRCIGAIRRTCLKCGGNGKRLILVDVGRTEEIECERCSVLSAAIREQDAQ